MISGATYLLALQLDNVQDVSDIDSIIFTFKGAKNKIQKEYPEEINYLDGIFTIPLYQEDTIALCGGYMNQKVLFSAQINYKNKSVGKTIISTLDDVIDADLHTEIVEGNNPSENTKIPVSLHYVDNVLVAKYEGDISEEVVEKAVFKYLEEHPVKAGISEEECLEIVKEYVDENVDVPTEEEITDIVSTYVNEHKDELKGDKGDKGDTPIKGVDYWNDSDKEEIKDYVKEVESTTQGINLIPYPYYRGDSFTHNGITFTVNEKDGSIVCNGTAKGGTAQYHITLRSSKTDGLFIKNGKQYILSGCPKNGSTSTYRLGITYNKDETGTTTDFAWDYGDGVTFAPIDAYEQASISIAIIIANGQTVDNLVFYPMLEEGVVKHTYSPTTQSNTTLYNMISNLGIAESVSV